jgi:outer membrane immunogenic protein
MKTQLLRTIATAAVFSSLAGVAQAADLVPQATVVDWSGIYVGAQIGYGGANMSGCLECLGSGGVSPSAVFADDLNINGITGGLHAGYNWQSDAIVFGFEGDINLNNWKDKVVTSDPYDWQTGSVDTLGSIRGRLGIASGDALFYMTGGVALSDAEWKSYRDAPADTAHFNNIGGVVGGGVELMAFSHASIRAEGLYYFFGDKVNVSNFEEANPGEHVKLDDMFVARIGASWHFN